MEAEWYGVYGPPTPRMHNKVWAAIDRISGRLALLLSAIPVLATPAVPAGTAVVIEVVVTFALLYNSPNLQDSIGRSSPHVTTPRDFERIEEAMNDALVWIVPLAATVPMIIAPPETRIVEVTDSNPIEEMQTLIRERDNALRREAEARGDLERLQQQVARANLTPVEIGVFGRGGHRVVQSPPPGQEVVGENITLRLVGIPQLEDAEWTVAGCRQVGGSRGPTFMFCANVATSCEVTVRSSYRAVIELPDLSMFETYYVHIQR